MRVILIVVTLLFVFEASADFTITVKTEGADRDITSSLVFAKKSCSGQNGTEKIKHPLKKCVQIEKHYKLLFSKPPVSLPPGDDEPSYEISLKSKGANWSRLVGRVSIGPEEDDNLRSLATEIIKINSK